MKGLGEQSDGAGRVADDERPESETTGRIIACAIEVHRTLGPGLLESVYEAALCLEMGEAGLRYVCQQPVPIVYKGHVLAQHRLDLPGPRRGWSSKSRASRGSTRFLKPRS